MMLQPLRDNPSRASVVQTVSFPAPVEGLDTSSPLAAMEKLRAVELLNWFPQPGYLEVRRGQSVHALLPGLTVDIESLMAYNGLTANTLFAAGGGSIYDVTTAASSQTDNEDGVDGTGNDTYTKVLLQCNGSDGGTTFTDDNRGGSSHTWTAAGNAHTDTGDKKFGTASFLGDGTGDYVTTPDHADFALGSGAFTVDCWFKCTATSGSEERLAGQCDSSTTASTVSFFIARDASNTITALVCQGGSSVTVTSTTTFTDAVNTGWHHLAFVRTGNTLRLYIDGTQEGGDVSISGSVNNSSSVLAIGTTGAVTSDPWTGWIDEFRLSVGIARWTANFTPPTAAYAATSSASVTTLSEDRWQHVNFANSGAQYLYIVNGTDAPRAFDGSTWSTPSITGVDESTFIHVNAHQKRLWFVAKNTMSAWYLATDAISGAATEFAVGSLFNKGGYLNAMATWTVDSGFGGTDDVAVFISSRGQCAIFQGTDPSSTDTWALIGVYDLPAPIGRRCFAKLGADLLLITVSGVLRLSLARNSDSSQVQMSQADVTGRISPTINGLARLYKDNFGWEICVYPRGTRLIVNVPTSETTSASQLVMNTLSAAWCEMDNHNACCWAVWQDRLFYGGVDSRVFEADVNASDVLSTIVATGQTAYQAPFSPGSFKRFTMIQPLVTATGTARPSLAISTDFVEASSLSTPVGAAGAPSNWGTAVWGTSLWGGSATISSDWTSTPALGRWASVKFQATTGADPDVDDVMQINGFVALAEVGTAI